MSRFRPAAFTINNYSYADVAHLLQSYESGKLTYLVFQRECGSEGTPHIQGYAVSKDSRSLSSWKSVVGDRAHIERANGSAKQNRDYCTKEETRIEGTEFEERGSITKQGLRTDLEQVYSLVKEGASEREICEADPANFIKFSTGIKRALLLHQERRGWKTTVFWWYGSTGTGKSALAAERFPEAYWKPGGTKWWDGYDGQADVIIDDYRRDLCTFSELLRLLDRYPLIVENKGGSNQFLARNLVITTPRSPRDTWESRTNEDLAQLERRIDEVRLFGEPVVDEPFVSSFNHP